MLSYLRVQHELEIEYVPLWSVLAAAQCAYDEFPISQLTSDLSALTACLGTTACLGQFAFPEHGRWTLPPQNA